MRKSHSTITRPILFLVFINDLPEHIKSKVRLFADDTAVYLAVSNLEYTQILQEMEFNPSKCTVIHVTRSKSIVPSQYTLYGHALDSVSSSSDFIWPILTPYMGVIPNPKMTFIFPLSCILALIFPIFMKYFPKCSGKGSFPKSQIKSLSSKYLGVTPHME